MRHEFKSEWDHDEAYQLLFNSSKQSNLSCMDCTLNLLPPLEISRVQGIRILRLMLRFLAVH